MESAFRIRVLINRAAPLRCQRPPPSLVPVLISMVENNAFEYFRLFCKAVSERFATPRY